MRSCPRSIVVAASMTALLMGCGGGVAPQPAVEVVPVSAATAEARDVPVTVRAIGTVTAIATVALKSQVEGQLTEIRFREGQEVHRGELLFVIDPRPFEAALREAQAQLAKNRAAAVQASAEAARFQHLIASGVVSHDEWDKVRTAAAAATAAVAADEAAVDTARIRLQYTQLFAPIDGRIGALLVHAGNLVKPNDTTLAIINQIRPTTVEFFVPQRELPDIRKFNAMAPLPVQAAPAGSAPVDGELTFIDNAIDATTGTVRLKGTFANTDEQLWPGQFVDVTLRVTTRNAAVMVPTRAVQAGQGGRFVYVIKSDLTVEPRVVELGAAVADDSVVTSGLTAGERVVTDGQLRLAPGRTVELTESPTPPGTPKP